MEKIILTFILVLSVICPSFANNLDTRSRGNPITLYNETPFDIGYMFSSYSKSARGFGSYSIKAGSTDIYHSGFGDTHARLDLGACTELNTKGYCVTFISNIIPQVYNAELVSTIHIKSLFEIEVRCLDGGFTSCLVN